MRGLYALVDRTAVLARGLDPVAFCDALLLAEPVALQLRAKGLGDAETLALLRALRPACRAAGVPLVGNDRVDLARAAECDWVHVGQTDASPAEVRAIAPGMPCGISTHDEAQLVAALRERPRYVAFGPVFTTRSKAQPDPEVGLAGLERAHALARAAAGVPLCAIGGITLSRAAEVARFADTLAVIGDLIPPHDVPDPYAWVTSRARAFQSAIAGVHT